MSQVSYGTITIVDTNDIESIIIEYAQNQSSSDPPESGWSTTRPTWKQNYFIWQRTRIHKSGTTADKDSFGAAVCLTGSTGATGSTGQSLSTTKTQYTHVASNVTITTSNHTSYSWTDNVPEYDSTKPVYWGRITNTYINPAKTEYIIYKDNGLTEAIANSVEANANASDALDKANESNSIATHANENAQGALSISRATQQHFWFNSATSGSIEAGAYITDTPIDTFKSGKNGGYLLARSDGVELGRGTNKFMTLSATALNFYRPGTNTIDATLASNGLQITNGSIVLGTTSGTAAGNVTLSNVDFTRSINGISRSNLRFAIGKNFGVKNDGTLYGTNVDINGRITAIAGLIGGWNIGTDTNKSLYYGNQVPGATTTNLVISKGSVENTNAIAGSGLNKTWFLTAGRQFGVDTNGILYASGANIQGQITVSAGSNVYTKDEVDDAVGDTATDLANYILSNDKAIDDLEKQIDGAIDTWYYNADPTTSNEPAVNWTTDALKESHLRDLYFNTSNGHTFRWAKEGNTYKWIQIEDADAIKALADAAKAQTTADVKRRVFVSQPTPPYDIGDLWVQGSSGDIYKCKVAKTSAQSYAASDWDKASKYTDDSTFNTFKTTTYATDLQQTNEAISLRATKTEAQGYANTAESNAKTDTTNKLKSYYTKTETDSAITQKAGEITASVSSTYETKTDATSKLNTAKSYTDTEITSAKAAIKLTTDAISTEVSKKVGNSEVISRINQSAETVKIQASKVEIDGTATFNAIKAKTDAAYDAKGAASAVQTNIEGVAVQEEQYIYISKASGTASVSGTTTWITEAGDKQNTWSTKRPTYNSSYPVLFVAKQKKVVSGTVTCTTPVKDDTTTIIDGGHITTGTIDASKATIKNISASMFTSSEQDKILNSKIEIGGRNLVWDTEWNHISTRWSDWGSPTTREIVIINGKRWLHLVTTASPDQGYSQAQDKRNGYGEIKAGDKVIISYSAYAKTAGQTCTVGCHWRNSSGTIVAQNWFPSTLTTTEKRYTSGVFTIPNDAVGFNVMVGDGTANAQELWISQVKIEFGTKATDWSPAPEDIQFNAEDYADTVASTAKAELDATKIDVVGESTSLLDNINAISDQITLLASRINFGNITVADNLTQLNTAVSIDTATSTVYVGDQSSFHVRINGTELGFYQGAQRVAYINNNQLYITQSVVLQQMDLGTPVNSGGLGQWTWKIHANGQTPSRNNLNLKWIG